MNEHKKRICFNLLSAAMMVLIFVFSFFGLVSIVFNVVYLKTSVIGFSMQPTLNSTVTDSNASGDVVYINRYSTFTLNDLVVAEVDWWSKGPIVKRLVAMPGDNFKIVETNEEYELYVNGALYYTKSKDVSAYCSTGLANYYNKYLSYLDSRMNSAGVKLDEDGDYVIVMQTDEYFLMGDNWAESKDCMTHGAVSYSEIMGRVEIVLKYGENKINSLLSQMLKILFC